MSDLIIKIQLLQDGSARLVTNNATRNLTRELTRLTVPLLAHPQQTAEWLSQRRTQVREVVEELMGRDRIKYFPSLGQWGWDFIVV